MRTHQPTVQQTTQSPLVMRKTCSCGRPMGPGGECAECQRKHQLGGTIQTKLRVNKPGDRYEREADKVADTVLSISSTSDSAQNVSTLSPGHLQRQTEEDEEDEEVVVQAKHQTPSPEMPSVTGDVVPTSGGNPLPTDAQAFFGSRLGHDFSQVRIHTDSKANQSAEALSARAFTAGNDVVFNTGEYNPASNAGKRLLAHELTHVVQQTQGGSNSHTIQRQSHSDEARDQNPKKAIQRILLLEDINRIVLEHEDGSVAMLDAVIEGNEPIGQYRVKYNPTTRLYETVSRKYSGKIRWARTGTSAGVAGKEIIFEVVDPKIVKFVFGGHSRLDKYADRALVSILDKMTNAVLSEDELYDLRKKGGTRARHWKQIERALDRYLTERNTKIAAREEALFQQTVVSNKLHGLEELYKMYRDYRIRSLLPSSSLFDPFADFEADFIEKLEQAGFASIEKFEQTIKAYEQAFEQATLQYAFDKLDYLERELERVHDRYEPDSYKSPTFAQASNVIEAFEQIREPTLKEYERAKTLKAEATQLEGEALALQSDPLATVDNLIAGRNEPAAKRLEAKSKRAQAQKLKSSAEETVTSVGETHIPIIGWRDFPRDKLLKTTTPKDFNYIIRSYAIERLAAVKRTRKRIEKNPKYIYQLGDLIKDSQEKQGIKKGSVHSMIISDLKSRHDDDSVLAEIIEIIALALSFISGPVGWVAGAVAFGTGVYQAIDAIQDYESAHDAYLAQFLANDPSSTWAILAVVGVGLDVAGAIRVLNKIEPAVDAFNKTPTDELTQGLVKFKSEIQKSTEISDRVKANLAKHAEAELKAREALQALSFKGLREIASGARAAGGLTLVGHQITTAAYYYTKRGLYKIDHFLSNRKIKRFIGDPPDPERYALVKEAFHEAVKKSRGGEGLVDRSLLSKQARDMFTTDELDDIYAEAILLHGQTHARAIKRIESEAAEVQKLGSSSGEVKSGLGQAVDDTLEVKTRRQAGVDLGEDHHIATRFRDENRRILESVGVHIDNDLNLIKNFGEHGQLRGWYEEIEGRFVYRMRGHSREYNDWVTQHLRQVTPEGIPRAQALRNIVRALRRLDRIIERHPDVLAYGPRILPPELRNLTP